MQGGVCYNKAIPVAMAALTGKNIIVPPDPGLMGAFGVALGIKEKIELGLTEKQNFELDELSKRKVEYKKPFICNGGKEKCDRECLINVIEVNGKRFPFGGACNKYYNLKYSRKNDSSEFDLVKYRQDLMFKKYAPDYNTSKEAITIGINNSFHTHTLYPFYYNFFSLLGLKVVLSDTVRDEALDREYTSLCYPAQISLMMFHDLLEKEPDFIFMPQIYEMKAENFEQRLDFNSTCVFVSGEKLFLSQAYKEYNLNDKLISPTLNFSNGISSEKEKFIEIGRKLNISDVQKIESAFAQAVNMQESFDEELKEKGREVLQELDSNSDSYAIVLVGRPYNAFTEDANKGIPRKFATKGVKIIPYDMLDFMDEKVDENMYWEGGKKILKTAKVISRNPQLFATYISNFSCGPDSLILTAFRDIIGTKPHLTLELDGHTADAGINTRIDAALDIISNYRKLKQNNENKKLDDYKQAYIEFGKDESFVIDSDGNRLPMNSPDVEILIPSMGDLAADLFAAAFRSLGYNAKALNESNPEVLRYGRSVASGKECLPLILLAGLLLDYIENEWDGKKRIAYFVVQGAGNCRLGQYPVFLRRMLNSKKIKNTALMVLMNEDGFAGFGSKFAMRGIQAILASDVLDDVRSAVLANSENPSEGIDIFNKEFKKLVLDFEKEPEKFYDNLKLFSINIKKNIPARIPIEKSDYIALLGEIYVRRDGFAHKWLNKLFAEQGFVVKNAYISEWIMYVDYLLKIDLLEPDKSFRNKLERQIRTYFTRLAEKNIKKALALSGYYEYSKTEIKPLLESGKHLVPLEFKGEPGLTTGTALYKALDKYCGVINVGPFGCMPTRITEAIAQPSMFVKDKAEALKMLNPKYSISEVFNGNMKIPFLTIETDGNVYPQVIESRLETFSLQCKRTAELMKISKNGVNK
jgi:predicted nucleotide-binding protein (sugar kinase/HSP70/actin superfamily)